MNAWQFIAAVTVVCAGLSGILWAVARTAPEGFEDADGFHYGRPDDDIEAHHHFWGE